MASYNMLLISCTGFYNDVFNVVIIFVIILTSCIHISIQLLHYLESGFWGIIRNFRLQSKM